VALSALVTRTIESLGRCPGLRMRQRLWRYKAQFSYLLVLYQDQTLPRPCCCIGVGLPSLYSHGFSCRTRTGAVRINSGGKAVLACRQVATVLCALGKASHVFAID